MLSEAQMVFFGANDAALPQPTDSQHVPLDRYRDNVKRIVTHPAVEAQAPRIVLVTPAPVDEHVPWISEQSRGAPRLPRRAERARAYAEAVRLAGRELRVPVLDLWAAFMAKAGWQPGQPLAGSMDVEQNPALAELLYDGMAPGQRLQDC